MRSKTNITLLLLCFSALFAQAQNYNADSLRDVLSRNIDDTTRVLTLIRYGHALMRKGQLEEALQNGQQGLRLATGIGFKKGLGASYNLLGNIYSDKSDFTKSLQYHKRALTIREGMKDKAGIAGSYNNIGIVYFSLSDYAKAIEFMQKSMKMQEELGNKFYVAACIGNIAVLYDKIGEDSLAMAYQQKSFNLHKELNDKGDMVASLNHLGSLYRAKKDYTKALELLNQALEIGKEVEELKPRAETHGNFGLVYYDMKKYTEAIDELEKGLALAKELGDKKIQTEQYNMMGNVTRALGKNGMALAYYKTGYTLARETGSLEDQQTAATGLYDLYKLNNNVPEALHYHELLTELKDSIFSTEKKSAFANLKTQFALDQQEREFKGKAEEELKKQEAEKKQQRFIFYIIIVILFIVLLFSYFLYQRFRIISSQKKIIEEQKELMEIKNKDITDSINYAKRIQEAVIPDIALKEKMFPDSFIFFRPRDIVSGDFYWFSEKNGKKLITAVDCTGHGVPGAFMSMIGNAFLNEVVNEKGITMPGEILSQLRYRVIQALRQTGGKGEQRDGMDISLLCVSADNKKADWAGANNPLWLIRNGELIEYKPNKRPIGYFLGDGLPFDCHHIELQPGDALYLLTDGFADQFGGPKGKKFKYSQLKKMMISMQHLTMAEQEAALASTFIEWKSELEQIDDVCLIGVRV